MKIARLTVAALMLGLPAMSALAQDDGQPQNPPPGFGQRGPRGPGGPGGPGGGPRDGRGPGRGMRPGVPPPVMDALDANHDGVVSSEEIANASAALKALDKNNDGQLTRDELLPPPPREGRGGDGLGPQGPPRGRRGPGGPGGQGQGEGEVGPGRPGGPPPGGGPGGPGGRRGGPRGLRAAGADSEFQPGGPDGPRGPGNRGDFRPPVPPVLAALDTNHDNVLAAEEIAGSASSLLKLDKNGDGKLTMEEIRPPRPEGEFPPDQADR